MKYLCNVRFKAYLTGIPTDKDYPEDYYEVLIKDNFESFEKAHQNIIYIIEKAKDLNYKEINGYIELQLMYSKGIDIKEFFCENQTLCTYDKTGRVPDKFYSNY